MAATFNQPQPNTIEALDDTGLEAIRANFEVLFRQSTQASDSFAASLAAISPIPVANGGTGLTSFTIGDIIFASGTTTLSRLADVATGNALLSGGVGAAPFWGKIGLTTHISGVLPVANGGTNIASFTTGDLIYASGSTTLSKLADVAVNQVLVSGGVGVAPAWSANPTVATLTTTGSISRGGDLISTAAGTVIRNNTADGSDNTYLAIAGGGAFTNDGTRGGWMTFHGNEEGSPGMVQFQPGNASGAVLRFRRGDGADSFSMDSATGNITLSYQMLGAVGSGGAPSFSFASDPDTGIFSGGANDMRFVAAGSQVFNVTTGGINWIGASNGPTIQNEVPSATNPVFVPYGGDPNSGLGSDGTGVSLIAGSIEVVKVTNNVCKMTGGVKFASSIQPAALNGNTDNYNPTGLHNCFIVDISASGGFNLTGLNAGTEGETHLLYNSGGTNIINLIHESASSSAANRFIINSAAAVNLNVKRSLLIVYYGSRWNVVT